MEHNKEDLVRVAHLVISDSSYAVDQAAINGFCVGANVQPRNLESFLKEKLAEDFPKDLPENWLYARGL